MKIEGITIEINGDLTGFEGAMKKCDRALRETTKHVNEINKTLKFNPESTELLAQKQKYLGDKVEETKNKLEVLKKAQQEVEEQFKNGTIDDNKYNEFQREVIKTESQLKTFKGQLDEVNKTAKNLKFSAFDKIGEKLKAAGDKLTKIGGTLTKTLTVPIAGLGAAVFAGWKEADEAIDTIIKKTGLQGKQLEDLTNVYNKLSSELPVELQKVADTVGQVNTRFGVFGEEAENISRQFIKFTELNNVDTDNTINRVSAAMKVFGESTKNTAKILDMFNYAGQVTGVNFDSLLQTIEKNGSSLKLMGLSMEQAILFAAKLQQSGVDTSVVFNRLGMVTQKFTAQGLGLQDGLAQLEDRFYSAKTEAEKFNVISEIFGARVAPQIVAALNNGSLSFKDFSQSTEEAKGSVEKTFDAIQDVFDHFKPLFNSLKNFAWEVGNSLQEILPGVLETLQGVIISLTEAWKGLSPEMQQFIIKAALVTAAIGPITTAVGGLFKTLSLLTNGVKLVTSIFSGSFSGISGSVTSALTGIVAKCTGFLGTIGGLFGATGTLATIIGGGVVALVAGIGYLIYKYWDEIKEYAGIAWEYIKSGWNSATTWLGEKWQSVKEIAGNVWNGITGTISSAVSSVGNAISTKWEQLKTFSSNTWDSIKNGATSSWESLKGSASSAWESICNSIAKQWEKLKGLAKSTWDWISSKFTGATKTINNPKITAPKTTGGTTPFRVLNSKDWYDKGGIFTRPAVIGIAEKRPEFVGALDDLAKIVRENTPQTGSGVNIHVARMEVKDDSDIDRIAQKLYKMIERERRDYARI